MPRRVPASVIAFAAALLALTIALDRGAEARGWERYLRLIRSGSTGTATVTKSDLGGSCEYIFALSGKSYKATARNYRASAGQQIPITYLPDSPATSCPGSPAVRLADEVVSYLFSGLSFPEQP